MRNPLFFLAVFFLFSATALAQVNQQDGDTTAIQSNDNELTSVDNEGQDDEGNNTTGQYIPGLLHSSADVYSNNTSYTFGIAYFKNRGYDSRYQAVAINGLDMASPITGRATYSQWGGLNRVFRWPENVLNTAASSFTFGNLGGATNYNVRASSYRKQIHVNYALTNRNYNNRIMLTYATGLMKNGWAFAASASTRFGTALSFVDGTSYNAYGYFLSAEKQFNKKHALNLAVWGAPSKRGMQGNSTQEVYDLTNDHYYNSNWGWYDGKKRNSRVRTVHEPVILLSHFFTPEDNKYQITTTLGTSFGKNSTTSLNWNDVPDPRPDYYRNLPSYFKDDEMLFNYYTNAWLTDESFRQINWDKMYEVNQLAAAQGKQAQYIVENKVYTHINVAGNSNIVANISNHIKLSGGIEIRGFRQRNYKTINDLLGGAYWLNEDKYAEGESPENPNVLYNDLDNIGKHLGVGDKFGYDYTYNTFKQKIWATAQFSYNHVDFHIGLSGSATELWRNSFMKNGRYLDESYGKSETKVFPDYGIKAGATFKINGRNYIVLNSMFMTQAPTVLNAFISPSTRNTYASDLKSEKDFSADLSYILRYPIIKMRLTAYYARFADITNLYSFYHDDYGSFVNYSMTGIGKENMGVELGLEVKLGSMFSIVLAGNYGDYTYCTRPNVTMSADNGYDLLGDGKTEYTEQVYWKNFHVAGTPQVAGTIGLKFNHKYWYVNINANYFDKIYCDLNPERRTSEARGTMEVTDPLYQAMVAQERLKGQFTLDVSLSKSWKIKRNTIGFNLSVTNVTNNKNLITTAREQRRFDYSNYDVNKFPPKYYYAFGTTFYFGINYTFN